MSDLPKRLRDEACGGRNWNAMLNGAADLIEAQAKEIADLYEMNLAQVKTIRTLQTKVNYYKEISEDMESELNDRT